jgi:hypothetical protein
MYDSSRSIKDCQVFEVQRATGYVQGDGEVVVLGGGVRPSVDGALRLGCGKPLPEGVSEPEMNQASGVEPKAWIPG